MRTTKAVDTLFVMVALFGLQTAACGSKGSGGGSGGASGGGGDASAGTTSSGGSQGSGGVMESGGTTGSGGAGSGGIVGSDGGTPISTDGGTSAGGGSDGGAGADIGTATGDSGTTGTGGVAKSGGTTGSADGAAGGGTTGSGGTTDAGPTGSGGTTDGGSTTGSGGTTDGGSTTGSGGMTSTDGIVGVGGCCSVSGGTTGTGGSVPQPPPLVLPIDRSPTSAVLEFGDFFFEVNPQVGARVVTLKYAGGPNLLTTKADDADNYGSTFRIAPQSAWSATGSPPPPEIDTEPYTMYTSTNAIEGTSATAASIGAKVLKQFHRGMDYIVAQYTITATADGKSFAPWEVTRVGPGGLTFYPKGDGALSGGSFPLPTTVESNNCIWFQYPASVSTSQRLIADGKEGWIAHVTPDGTVLIKSWGDVPLADQAPGEGEVSIYVDGGGKFIEIDTQGAYEPLANGRVIIWSTLWYVRKLPADITATVGNQALLDWVRTIVP
jgi:hypothetical protein